MKWLTQYAALEAAATAGPWEPAIWNDSNEGGYASVGPRHGMDTDDYHDDPDSVAGRAAMKDAQLLAFLRNSAPKLARLKAAVDALHHEFTEAGIRELRAARAELDGEGE